VPSYDSYLAALKDRLQGVRWETYGKSGAGPLVCFSTPGKKKLLYVTSGFHGEEPFGPITFVKHGQLLVDMAKASGVGLRVYPCTNPEAWERGTRYNAKHDRPSNAFFEYETAPGEWVAGLKPDMHLRDMRIRKDLTPESRALAADLALKPVPSAALDIHQDIDFKDKPITYAYVSGKFTPYRSMARAAARFATVGSNTEVEGITSKVKTDRDGLVPAIPDGSIQDYFTRLGTTYSATLETSTGLPLKQVMGVNLVWLMGFVELASR